MAALRDVEAGAEVDWSGELSALEVDQTRIVRRAEQVAQDFANILDEYILNRMDPSPTAERVLLFRLQQIARDRSIKRFEASFYQELVAAHDDGQFGQLDMLSNLIKMLDLSLQASFEHAPAALEALQEARVTNDQSRRPQLLEATIVHQNEVLNLYALLLEKMEEWEDFQEILDLWRGLVEDQADINRRYRELGER